MRQDEDKAENEFDEALKHISLPQKMALEKSLPPPLKKKLCLSGTLPAAISFVPFEGPKGPNNDSRGRSPWLSKCWPSRPGTNGKHGGYLLAKSAISVKEILISRTKAHLD
jgi:hypothetical protein